MNPRIFTYISKKIAESLSEQSEEISSAVYANVPGNASLDELIPIVIGNVLQIAVSASVCMTLDLLEHTGTIPFSDKETTPLKK